MQANWSLILNILLLVGVLVTIGLLIKARTQQRLHSKTSKPTLSQEGMSDFLYNDDIIAVRKINPDALRDSGDTAASLSINRSGKSAQSSKLGNSFANSRECEAALSTRVRSRLEENSLKKEIEQDNNTTSIMLFLLAKENRQFAGYELLQTVLAAGLRFGEEQLFHRHQFPNGQGPVLCSLAAATALGTFDLQNMGAFSVRGLCLFMKTSKNPGIDKERFSIMLETAKQLSEGLDAHLLDDKQKPLTTQRIESYLEQLQVTECAV